MLDGPALRVRQEGSSDRLFPIQRLSTIVVSGCVQWDTPALLHCAEQGVSINFLSKKGSVRARVISGIEHKNDYDFNDIINQYIELPGCEKIYRRWLLTQRFFTQQELADALNINCKNLYGKNYDEVLQAKLYANAGHKDLLFFNKYLHQLIVIYITEKLLEKGIDIESPILDLAGINLVSDLSDLCHTKVMKKIVTFIRHLYNRSRKRCCARPTISISQVIQLFEQQKECLDAAIERYFRRFFQHILSTIYDHVITR